MFELFAYSALLQMARQRIAADLFDGDFNLTNAVYTARHFIATN